MAIKQQHFQAQLQEAKQDLIFKDKPLDIPQQLQHVYARIPKPEKVRLHKFLSDTTHGHNVKEKFRPVVENLITGTLNYWQRTLSADTKCNFNQLDEHSSSLSHLLATAGSGGAQQSFLLNKDMCNLTKEELPGAFSIIKKLSKKLSTQISRRYNMTAKHKQLSIRQTIRQNMRFGGVMLSLKYKTKKVQKPRIVVLCDVSASMKLYSHFSLLFIYSLAQIVTDLDTFAFADNITKLPNTLRKSTDIESALATIITDLNSLGQGTDLDKALTTILTNYSINLTPATLLIIISDAKTLAPARAALQLYKLSQKVKSILWLNTQPNSLWLENKSVLEFQKYCQMVECKTINHLAKILRYKLIR